MCAPFTWKRQHQRPDITLEKGTTVRFMTAREQEHNWICPKASQLSLIRMAVDIKRQPKNGSLLVNGDLLHYRLLPNS